MAMNLVAWGTSWGDGTWEDDPPAWELADGDPPEPGDATNQRVVLLGVGDD